MNSSRAIMALSIFLAFAHTLPASEKSNRDSKVSKPTLPPKEAAKACLITAEQLMRHGHRREAIILFERARQLDPKQQAGVCRQLAVLYDLGKVDRRALAEFRLALAIDPHDAELLNDFGCYYLTRRDYVTAEKHFRASIAIDPRHERAATNLGMALGLQGEFQESFEAFERASGRAAAHSNVGMLLAKSGDRKQAIDAFKNALNIDPDMRQARVGLEVVQGTGRLSEMTADRR